MFLIFRLRGDVINFVPLVNFVAQITVLRRQLAPNLIGTHRAPPRSSACLSSVL